MFSPFVYIFSVLLLEVRQGVVPYLADERVWVSETIVEKFFRQTVNKLVYRFKIVSGMEVGDESTPGIVTNSSKTFRLKNLKMTIVGPCVTIKTFVLTYNISIIIRIQALRDVFI